MKAKERDTIFHAGIGTGRQQVVDWFDKHFELYQNDPMYYHISMLRDVFHKQIEEWGLEWRGGW